MVNLTIKDLFHKKGKFLLIIIGISLSVFLIQYSAGMYNGVLSTSTEIPNRYEFDCWVRMENSDNFLDGGYINDSVYYKIQSFEDVEYAERLIFDQMEAENEKRVSQIILVGFDLINSENEIKPWDIIKGDDDDLREENTIIVEESIKENFKLEIDDRLKIGATWMKIIGFCENAKFMGNGYVWASLETAKNVVPWIANWSTTIGVNLDKDYTIDEFQDDIADFIDDDLVILSNEELINNTHSMIINEGGLGGAIYILVGMGLFVGLIIISITMYQSIQEKIPEFGTIKAIGASKNFLNKMLFGQTFVYITLGFILGTILAVLLSFTGLSGIIPVMIHMPTTFIFYAIFIGTSSICAYFSIRKVHKIDPAIVFRT